MTRPRSFEDLKNVGKKPCPRCGGKASGTLLVAVRENGKYVKSRSRSLCETCTLEMFADFTDQLEEAA